MLYYINIVNIKSFVADSQFYGNLYSYEVKYKYNFDKIVGRNLFNIILTIEKLVDSN